MDNFFGLYCVLTNGTMDTIQSRTKEQAQMDHRELFDQRNHIVVKDNDLVRARYNLTVNQQKIIAYIISLIKPEDKEMKMYEISISDYCELCGIEKDYFYQDIKDVIDNLDSKSFWVETDQKVFKFRWISEIEIIKRSGKVRLMLNSNLKKYLLDLKEKFTTYELYNILALKSKYSIRMYELFKSYSFQGKIRIDLEELKQLLYAENYKDYRGFRRRVIEPAINEINEFTDLEVSFDPITKGKKIIALEFTIKRKGTMESAQSYMNTILKINKVNHEIAGQMTLLEQLIAHQRGEL